MPHDINKILKIWLSNYVKNDFISSTLEKTGLFSVNSAYNLPLDHRNSSLPNSSVSANGDRNLWKLILNAKIPHKVSIYLHGC
jgi:hypothetical protein